MTKRTEGDKSDLVYDSEVEKTVMRLNAERKRKHQEDMADPRQNNNNLND